QYIELYANAWLMGQGDLSAVVSLPVDPHNSHFEVKAVLSDTPLTALNPVIRPLANVEIKSGHLTRMDFTMVGNNSSASVDMTLRYEELKIELLKQQVGGWRERTGLSNLVNWAVIKSDNPDERGPRTAQTTVERDPYRSAYNYVWKGISAAALQTAETGVAKALMPKEKTSDREK
ncbi:MAG: hypothetical protein LUD68_04925, partial [Rikenellaceae bacterium]|nr:hypothetical protein [Rikenellaceae bacterium]